MNENQLKPPQPAPRSDWLDELFKTNAEAAEVEAWSVAWSSWTELLEEAEPPSRQDLGEALQARLARKQEASGVPHLAYRAVRPYQMVGLRGLIAAVAASLFLACSMSLSPWQQKEWYTATVRMQPGDVAPRASDGEVSNTLASHGNLESSDSDDTATIDTAGAIVAWEAQEAEVDWRLGRVGQLLEMWDHTMQPDDARIYFASQILSSLAWELDRSGL